MKRLLAALVALATPHLAQATPAEDADKVFTHELAAYATMTRSQAASRARAVGGQIVERTEATTRQLDAVRATPELAALGTQNSATAADRLSAAVSTDLEGVEAGVTLAPAKLLGSDDPLLRGFTLTAASLEDGAVRGGVGWVFESKSPTMTYASIGLRCDPEPLIATAEELRASYVAICGGLSAEALPADRDGRERWLRVALACGRPVPEDARLVASELATSGLYAHARDLSEAAKGVDTLAGARTVLAGWVSRRPSITDCITDDLLLPAVDRATLAHARHKLGITVHGDFFPLRFGFQPASDEPLSRGELQRFESRVEYQLTHGLTTLTLGMGAGYAREMPDDDLAFTVSPSLGVRVLVAALGSTPLARAVVHAETPVLAVGASMRAERAFDPPATQDTRWNAIEVTAFVDFKISKELGFRLGVPLRAEIVTRDADPDAMPLVEEKRALQWSVPVFIATVLKL